MEEYSEGDAEGKGAKRSEREFLLEYPGCSSNFFFNSCSSLMFLELACFIVAVCRSAFCCVNGGMESEHDKNTIFRQSQCCCSEKNVLKD